MKILFLCTDLGIPVLGRKGASVHVRSLVSALSRAGHTVVLASPLLSKSPWEVPAKLDVSLLHLPPSADTVNAVLSLKAFNEDRKSTRLNSSHVRISYAVFCLKKK